MGDGVDRKCNMYSPSPETVRAYLRDYDTVPVSREILSDVRTPIEVLSALLAVDDHCFILESIEDRKRWGRYTIIGFQPAMDLTCTDGIMEIRENGSVRTVETDHPSDVISEVLSKHRSPVMEGMPRSPEVSSATSPMITSNTPSPPSG